MKLDSIQFLRAVAALLVVYEHSLMVQINYSNSWQQSFYHLNHFGCIGVDIFFVISGFIITYIARDYSGTTKSFQFLAKRFLRINPIYYIATLLCLLVKIFQWKTSKLPILDSLINSIGSLIDSLIILPTSDDLSSFSPILIVGWTLSFEWLFYLLFFLLILCKATRITIFLPVIIITLITLGQIIHSNDLRFIFLTNPIMLEFVLGIIICHVFLSRYKIPKYVGITCVVTGIISYLLLVRFGFGETWHYSGTISGILSFKRFFLWGIPSCLIVAGCVFLEQYRILDWLFKNRLCMLLGEASYSIYLTHLIIFTLFTFLYQKVGFFLPADLMIWIQASIAITIAIGFYNIVENKYLQKIQKNYNWNIMTVIKNKNNLSNKQDNINHNSTAESLL